MQSLTRNAMGMLTFLAFCLVMAPGAGFAAWTNGQAADIVLGKPDFTSSGYTASQTSLAMPAGVCYDSSSGSLFVTDYAAHRVLRWSSSDAYTSGSAATNVLGQANFSDDNQNRGGGVAANTMSQPLGCVVSSSGSLFVADRNNNRILRFDNAASKANGADADGVLGQPSLSVGTVNTGGRGAATLFSPWNPSLDADGRLWIADNDNSRVLRYDNAVNKANGAAADGVLGATDFSSAGGGAVSASSISSPYGVATGPNGALWVADSGSKRVLRFDNAASKANGAAADGVLGQINFSTVAAGTTASTFLVSVYSVSADQNGGLYVADSGGYGNDRILYFANAASKANGASADNVLGQPNFTSSGPHLTATGLSHSTMGVSFDPGHGRLWVGDFSYGRVLSYYNPALDPAPSGVPALGAAGAATLGLLLVAAFLYRARRKA